ncbi:hypothetical protein HDK77DRAFT_304958 [Phyllosticta capitalensis]
MSPSNFEKSTYPCVRAIMEQSSNSVNQLEDSASPSARALMESTDAAPRALANTSASMLSSATPSLHQAPPAPPQSVQSSTFPQSEPDLQSANDRLIENPRNSPASSIQGRTSISLTSIDKRLETLRLNRYTPSQATSTEVLDLSSERSDERSSSPLQEMAARRKSEMLSSDKPAPQSTDGVREHEDWKDEIVTALDRAIARTLQLANDDHDRNPGTSVHDHFFAHLVDSLVRQQLSVPDWLLKDMEKFYNKQVDICHDQAHAIKETAEAVNELAKTCGENSKTISNLAMNLANSKKE